MNTNKFNVGDKVRCVVDSAANGVELGGIYTVKNPQLFKSQVHKGVYRMELLEVRSSPYDKDFELVQEGAVLTPEEVFEHLRKGTKLQYRRDYRDSSGAACIGWRDCSNPQFANILNRVWRIKPEPEVIELNGKKYREIME